MMENVFSAIMILCALTIMYPLFEITVLVNMIIAREYIHGSYSHTIRHILLLCLLIYAQFNFSDVFHAAMKLLNGENLNITISFAMLNIFITHHLSEERD